MKHLVWDNIFVSLDIIFKELMIWFQCLSTLLLQILTKSTHMCRLDSWRSPNFHYGHLLWLFLWTGVVTLLGEFVTLLAFQVIESLVLMQTNIIWPWWLTLLGEIVHGTLCTTLSSVCHIAISVMVMPEITRSLFCKARVSCYLGLCLLVPAFLAHRTRPTLHPWCLCTCKLVIRSTAFNIFHDSFMF